MGLDTTFDCWHGSYSSFMRFRRNIAKYAGIELNCMEGFGGDRPWDDVHDNIKILLYHSDCDGEISAHNAGLLAVRLRELASLQPPEEEMTVRAMLQFALGLEQAAMVGKPVEFR